MSHATTLDAAATPGSRAPGPRGHLLWGMLPELRRDMLGLYRRTAQEYGDVVRLRFLWVNTYAINSPDAIKRVLQDNNRNYVKGKFINNVLKMGLGENLLTTDGESWLSRRRLMQPAFHRQRIASFGAAMTDASQLMVQRWRDLPAGAQLDMEEEMMAVTLRIAGQTLFSVDLLGEAQALGHAFTDLSAFVNYRMQTAFPPPPFVPTAHNRRFRRALQTIDRTVQAIIDGRRRQGGEHQDLLSMLMEARDADTGEAMNDQQLRDEIVLMMFAGHETTATTLTWALYELARNSEAEAKLHAEVDSVLNRRPPTMQDLPNLPYTRMVIDEALRLYPAAWSLARQALNEDEVAGYMLPAGADLSLMVYNVHRDPRWWDDPEHFDPERFTPERSTGRPHYAYLPFGGGPRLCIGNQIALTEAPLILASIAQQYRLRLAPGHPVQQRPLLTLRTSNGLPMIVERR
jgi:cytochrome P450